MHGLTSCTCLTLSFAVQHVQSLSVLVLAGETYPLEKAAEAVNASLKDARGPKILLVG